jgi:hypothetical protein
VNGRRAIGWLVGPLSLLAMPAAAVAANYATDFPAPPAPESPISEGGQWIGGQTAGGNLWGDVQTKGGLAFGVSEPTQYGDPTALLTGAWGGSQTVQGVVKIASAQPANGCCHEIELRLRQTISAGSITGYEVYCSLISGNKYCHVASWGGPNGAWVNLDTCVGGAPSRFLQDGDVFMATVTGNNPTTITAYINGAQIMQVKDTGACTFSDGKKYGPWPKGNPGIGFYDNEDGNWSSFGWSSFMATDGVNPADGGLAGDLAVAADLAVRPDLAIVSDAAVARDLAAGAGDQSMKPGADLAIARDLAAGPADQSMAPGADLIALSDGAAARDLAGRAGDLAATPGPDLGSTGAPADGCGCRLGSRSRLPLSDLLAFVLAGALLVRPRTRGRARRGADV